MEWPEMIKRWSGMPVKLLDIRHFTMKQGDALQSYPLPANAFLFANQGEARLILDGVEASHTNSLILHSGKGAVVNIKCVSGPFDYYMILYKPVDSIQAAHEGRDRIAPSLHHYAFQAKQPWSLLALLEPMIRLWREGGELDRLQVMGLFYQFVHEQFRQLQIATTATIEPDLADQLAAFIRTYYRQAISMEILANRFHYSSHYLSRIFKRKYGCSPIEFLVRTRMNRAKALLAEADMTIRDIAESIGYADMYYFNRLFKKQTGATPTQFKMHSLGLKGKGSNRTKITPESFIAPQAGGDYIVNSDNHYQQEPWRVDEMNGSFKPSFAVSLLFSLSLLLAACGGTGSEDKQAAQSNNQQQAKASSEASEATRPYTDALGRQMEIPVQPRKVVVITYGGYLLPLGLKPIGADEGTLEQYPEEMADVQSIGKGVGNLEAIIALEPDLIILPDYHDEATYSKYAQIAPTAAVAWGGDPDVINTLRAMGDIMNRKQEAEAWISKFEGKLQRIRDQIDITIKPGSTAITFILYQGEFLLGGKGGTLGKLIYEDYGFQMPEQFKKYADGGTALSIEQFADQQTDFFFTQMTEEEMGQLEETLKEPVYQTIPAVRNNRIINVTRDKWNYGPYVVDEAVDELIEQMKGLQ
ncbi:helix-turn-helix domain-containing protein [Paenibacillus oenotherae]|uniref:Helix-turn-helix domain-containing protein n=1 Tax=Paenibacillus oenotherae TaxID=1435645 RepID=A0ABS7D8K7_9BACL|nr:helix-turn-helix domain-containing protein [Paenibacillus oenotherae]MBW7475508.1 helix-turn-helix domain-containing protein [Paenibacillus oenotherae]